MELLTSLPQYMQYGILWVLFAIIVMLWGMNYLMAKMFVKSIWEKDQKIYEFIEKIWKQNELIERLVDMTRQVNDNIIRLIDKK